MCYDDDILLSFTAGREPLPDDGVGALGTCVAAMAQLCKLVICHLPLPVLGFVTFHWYTHTIMVLVHLAHEQS